MSDIYRENEEYLEMCKKYGVEPIWKVHSNGVDNKLEDDPKRKPFSWKEYWRKKKALENDES